MNYPLSNQREAHLDQMLNSLFLWPEQFACTSFKGTSALTQLLNMGGAKHSPHPSPYSPAVV